MTLEALRKLNNKKVDVLGTKYTLRIVDTEKDTLDALTKKLLVDDPASARCLLLRKIIMADIANWDFTDYETNEDTFDNPAVDEALTHELYHAFFYESGLDNCTFLEEDVPWAKHEELVDWCAIQFPKILAARRQLGIKDEL